MRAIVCRRYGSPDVLSLEEVERPRPGDDEVLVRVHAASINAWDWDLLRGKPFIVRMWGLLKPRYPVPGADIAGRVEAVGARVSRFKPGDAVFGDLSTCGWGGFAEQVCAREGALALKPPRLTFEEAAAVPQAAAMALQGLTETRPLRPGEKVLVNGAGGGVGTFAVQMAKAFGAQVTGVDHTEKLDVIRAAGADTVIDYTKADFTREETRYDLILDTEAHRSMLACGRALRPGGAYVMIGGSLGRAVQLLLVAPAFSLAGHRTLRILAAVPNRNLARLGELLEAGTIAPIIDRRFPLENVPAAFRYFGQGHAKGKVVITLLPDAGR